MGVSVATSYGVVNLSGTVDQAPQIRRAGAIAAGVKGVKAVHNAITVK
jgi:osmotically-inducible protein OsmY